RTVANPALGAVDDPVVAVALGDRAQALRGVRPAERLGEAEGAEQLGARKLRQPLCALLVRTGHSNRAHDEAVLHADEGGRAGVYSRKLEGDPAAKDGAVLELAGLLPRLAEQPELRHAVDDSARKELGLRPQVVGVGAH